jgi:hypothetical protein
VWRWLVTLTPPSAVSSTFAPVAVLKRRMRSAALALLAFFIFDAMPTVTVTVTLFGATTLSRGPLIRGWVRIVGKPNTVVSLLLAVNGAVTESG